MTSHNNNDGRFNVFWLGSGFTRDLGLPLFNDFLRHTKLLYIYEGLWNEEQIKSCNGNKSFTPRRVEPREGQPTDEEDGDALKEVLKFYNEQCKNILPTKQSDNLEEIYKLATTSNVRREVRDAIMRVVVRTFDVALHYRFRNCGDLFKVINWENKFWEHDQINCRQKKLEIYKYFINILSKTEGNIAIITTNWDAGFWEIWCDLWSSERNAQRIMKGKYETIEMPGYPYEERVTLNEALKYGFELPKGEKRILYFPIHGAVNLLTCEKCLEEQESYLVGGEVHNFKYRENYNFKGWKPRDIKENRWFKMNCLKHEDKNLRPILLPPKHTPSAFDGIIEREYDILNIIKEKAAECIRNAKSLHFIGYSFPDTDKEVETFFKKNLKEIEKMPISVTCREAYNNIEKEWGGYELIENCKNIEKRKDLTHFISQPPFPCKDK